MPESHIGDDLNELIRLQISAIVASNEENRLRMEQARIHREVIAFADDADDDDEDDGYEHEPPDVIHQSFIKPPSNMNDSVAAACLFCSGTGMLYFSSCHWCASPVGAGGKKH